MQERITIKGIPVRLVRSPRGYYVAQWRKSESFILEMDENIRVEAKNDPSLWESEMDKLRDRIIIYLRKRVQRG